MQLFNLFAVFCGFSPSRESRKMATNINAFKYNTLPVLYNINSSYPYYCIIIIYISIPPYSASCSSGSEYVCQWVEGKRPPAQVVMGGTTTCARSLCQWLKEKLHQRKLQLVTTTMCASGVLALVDRRITPQAQGGNIFHCFM